MQNRIFDRLNQEWNGAGGERRILFFNSIYRPYRKSEMRLLFPTLLIAMCDVVSSAPAATASMLLSSAAPMHSEQTLETVAYLHTWKTIEVETHSGRAAKIRNYIHSCSDDGRPAVSATANHGIVTFKDGIAKACGRMRPVTELWYQAEPGFHGADEITVGAPFYEGIDLTVR